LEIPKNALDLTFEKDAAFMIKLLYLGAVVLFSSILLFFSKGEKAYTCNNGIEGVVKELNDGKETYLAIVTPDNKVSIRPVQVGERVGSDWVIRQGLKNGEKVIAEGTLKVREGMTVQAVPFQPAKQERR